MELSQHYIADFSRWTLVVVSRADFMAQCHFPQISLISFYGSEVHEGKQNDHTKSKNIQSNWTFCLRR